MPEEFDVGVTVPDLPGCFGVAPDMEDARTMTDEAITFHIDEQHGDVLPKPTSRRRSR